MSKLGAAEPMSILGAAEPMSMLGAAVPASTRGAAEPATITDGSPTQAHFVEPARKTVASKVLSAMAFERVTGIKADPARLVEGE